MIRKHVLRMILPLAALFVLNACSNDDDGGRDCDSCTIEGQRLEICDNGNGTYTLTFEGESETITEEDLEDLTPKEFVNAICALGNLGL